MDPVSGTATEPVAAPAVPSAPASAPPAPEPSPTPSPTAPGAPPPAASAAPTGGDLQRYIDAALSSPDVRPLPRPEGLNAASEQKLRAAIATYKQAPDAAADEALVGLFNTVRELGAT